jgi:D-psicose/D-tagatose/L-ribulose 3-epimerase
MKIAISNIGWHPNEEADVAKALQELGVNHVEIAPTKVWEDPTKVTDEQIREYLSFWRGYGIEIVAFQSMLFGKNDLTLFDDDATRAKTKATLDKFIELAGRMQAKVLVFGSPKNRRVPEGMDDEEVEEIAEAFFTALGVAATANNTSFCIEPNAPQYDCNFVTTAAQGRRLVADVANPGFGLHLDAACMTMAGDNPDEIIAAKDYLRHFHISAPFLGLIEEKEVQHQKMADALRSIDYQGFTSIEMRPAEEGENVGRVRQAVAIAQKYYS